MTLFAARHARVAVDGLCYGRQEVETILGDEETAQAILDRLGDQRDRIDAVWTSPASRCRRPAERIAETLGVLAHVCAPLHELHYGEWEGRSWDALEREDGERLRRWMGSWQSEAPPGGETVDDLEGRVGEWLKASEPSGLLVGHAGVIRALWVILRSASWEDAMAREIEHLEIEPFQTMGSVGPRSLPCP